MKEQMIIGFEENIVWIALSCILADAAFYYYRKKRHEHKEAASHLRIEGQEPAPLTPAPDDAELSAQALLESLVSEELSAKASGKDERSVKSEEVSAEANTQPSTLNSQLQRGATYYQKLSRRIRQVHEQERRMTMRYVAYCEKQTSGIKNNEAEMLSSMEKGLYSHLDTIERNGGELKRRWQHVLAEIIVRQMES